MKSDLWANYETALKLILTGSTTGRLDNDQQTVFKNMLSQGMTRVKDYNAPFKSGRNLPGVQTQEYCTNTETKEHETYYYIPDVFKLMIQVHGKRSIHTLPVDLNYLNSLSGSAGEIVFISGEASEHQEWLESPEGKEYWNLLCRKIDIQHDIADIETTHHQGIPSEKESQKQQRTDLDNELANVVNRLQDVDCMAFIHPVAVSSQSVNAESEYKYPWCEYARKLGIAIHKDQPHLSLEQISEKVHKQMVEDNIVGQRNFVVKPESIKKHALTGITS